MSTLTPTSHNNTAAWEQISGRLRQAFNLDHPADRFAFDEWEKSAEKQRKAASEHELVYALAAAEELEAAIDYFKADIEENKLLYQLKVARNRVKLTRTKLVASMGEQGFFLDEDDHQEVVPAALGVYKVSKDKIYQQVRNAALALAAEPVAPGAESTGPDFPASLGEGILEFRADLVAFIKANGAAGREVVRRLCTDPAFAKKVHQDEEMPKPLQFLAGLSLDLHKRNKLPSQEDRPIGFAAK